MSWEFSHYLNHRKDSVNWRYSASGTTEVSKSGTSRKTLNILFRNIVIWLQEMAFICALDHVLVTPRDTREWRHFKYFGSDSDDIMDSYNRWHSRYCCFRRQSFSSQLPLFSLLLFFTKDTSRWNKVKFRPLRTSKHQRGICDAKWHRWEKRNN